MMRKMDFAVVETAIFFSKKSKSEKTRENKSKKKFMGVYERM